jgi:hypothetical protein
MGGIRGKSNAGLSKVVHSLAPRPIKGMATSGIAASIRDTLAARWRIYHRTIEQPDTIDGMVMATCVLHTIEQRQPAQNEVCIRDCDVDQEDPYGTVHLDRW